MKFVFNDLWTVSQGPAHALEDAPAPFRLQASLPVFSSRQEAEQEARRRAAATDDTPFPKGE